MRRKTEIALAVLTLVFALVHLVGEFALHSTRGQFLPFLWLHCGADLLLVCAAVRMLRGPGAVGLACGAWGLAFGLSATWFFQAALRLMENRAPASAEMDLTLWGLAFLAAGLGFGVSLSLSWRRAPLP